MAHTEEGSRLTGRVSRQELGSVSAWDDTDHVPRQPEMTEFRRRLRYQQACWREANGHPVGSQPIAPRQGQRWRPVGSRLPLGYAERTGANFLTPRALDAARTRAAAREAHQSFDHQRFWADLLWSPSLAVNLAGDLAGDLNLADRVVHAWWPDVPGTVCDIRFSHSPGRLDPGYLNSLRAFDIAFVLDLGDGTRGVIGVDVKYHEWAKPEIPKPSNLPRYLAVANESGAFASGSLPAFTGRSRFCEMWLEHLLMLSMLQHASRQWSWGRYVVVHPGGNIDIADACRCYADMLSDRSTFRTDTLERLLAADVLPLPVAQAVRDRYLPGPDAEH